MEAAFPSTPGPSKLGKGPVANLAARRAAGEIHADPVQERVVQRLQAVHDQLVAVARHPAPKPGLLTRLGLASAPKPPAGPPGLYIWGPVGRGKSMQSADAFLRGFALEDGTVLAPPAVVSLRS